MRPLSYTQISRYQACPLWYKLQYIDRLKPKDKWYFSFGTTIHACVRFFFRVPLPSLEELLQFYEQNWLAEGYESAEKEANYKAYGREILAKFWEIHRADFRMPVAVEKVFHIDIEGVKLTGYIDRIDKLDSGGLSIVDYKTDKELFTIDDLETNLQLTLYQLAAQETWGLPVERLTLYHMWSNTPCSCRPRDKRQLDQARQLVLEIAKNIAEKRFPAIENRYCPCDFPEHCPYYRQKYVAIVAEPKDIWRGMTEAVEHYVSLQSQIKELESQLEEIKQLIINFCQAEGINRVYGREHAITYKLMEKTGFNEDEVRALLEPEGLWPRVVSLDQSRLKQLITDEGVAKDIRDKLEALRQVISTYPQLRVRKLREEE
ncbi:PD-(D/E)XK nuclease family protein [Dehalococcoidales bacterium]|nr:PD-(D/E)XK nuclease family protein [Dehalococcoidales bacterium]MCL0094524.1 PD-(D/E)XK nuclease family protein [Dehalococcoidales bacterium]